MKDWVKLEAALKRGKGYNSYRKIVTVEIKMIWLGGEIISIITQEIWTQWKYALPDISKKVIRSGS